MEKDNKKLKNMKKITLITAIGILFASVLFSTGCNSESDGGPSANDGNGGTGGSMARFTVKGDYLYTVDYNSLKLFDISEAENPQYQRGKDQYLDIGIETIFPMDTLLFIGSQNGMYVFNITRPDYPQEMSYVTHIRSCDPVVASGNYAYVTLNSENMNCGRTSNVLHIYNIENPSEPVLIHTETGFRHPRGLGIDGTKLFICDDGLRVYDVSDPEKPVWTDDLSHIPAAADIDAYDVIPLNGLLLLTGADGLYQFDYRSDKLSLISKIEIDRDAL